MDVKTAIAIAKKWIEDNSPEEPEEGHFKAEWVNDEVFSVRVQFQDQTMPGNFWTKRAVYILRVHNGGSVTRIQ